MILCSGCFDGIHAGHVAYLASAKMLCAPDERLAVAIAADDYIRTQKGREPHWPEGQRALAVAALRMVDYVSLESVAEMIEGFHPRYFVKGTEWRGKLPATLERLCEAHQTRIVYVPTEGTHVSEARA